MVGSLLADAGDAGSIPGLGGFHLLQDNYARTGHKRGEQKHDPVTRSIPEASKPRRGAFGELLENPNQSP